MTDSFRGQLEIPFWDAVAMIVGVLVLYTLFSLLLALFGQRLRARISVFSVAFLTLVGSVAARAMLGRDPTMAGGLIVLVELLVLQGLFHWLRHPLARLGWREPGAKAVVVNGVVNTQMLAAVQVTEQALWIRLRRAGITRREQIAYAIIEADGSLSILRAGDPVDPELLTGVAGI